MYVSGGKHPEFARELATFLVLAALSEAFGYPVIAKMYHQRLGTFRTVRSRVINFDVRERFWAPESLADRGLANY